MSLNDTPSANRLHIGFFGKRNSGKSSLINAFTGQKVSIVSDVPGTTTDPVSKAMEIHGLGACSLIDTAGFDDEGELGKIRVEQTKKAAGKIDIAVLLFSGDDFSEELEWLSYFKSKNTPVVQVVSKSDAAGDSIAAAVAEKTGTPPIEVSAVTGRGIGELREALLRSIPEDFERSSIVGSLVSHGDSVLLVMPQDIQAPKGRLILPQVQTIRDLLDKKCIVTCVTTDMLDASLKALSHPPKLIITDSQVFREVYDKKPAESLLTSFSVLFAAYKGDIRYYVESAARISSLNGNSRVLIAECCTHAPLSEDIGRVKLPAMLRKKYGAGMSIDIVSGTDFPANLTQYDLIIQCGACMFNRKYVMTRIERAREQRVPMTNYGIAIAFISGILDKVSI